MTTEYFALLRPSQNLGNPGFRIGKVNGRHLYLDLFKNTTGSAGMFIRFPFGARALYIFFSSPIKFKLH